MVKGVALLVTAVECVNEANVQQRARGRLRWFSPRRGYGFLDCEGFDEDVLLHTKVLADTGESFVTEGSIVEGLLARTPSGLRMTKITRIADGSVDCCRAKGDGKPITYLPARLKWFDIERGFGFVTLFDDGDDCYLHASVLGSVGLGPFEPGLAMAVVVETTDNGKSVKKVGEWSAKRTN